MDKKNLGNGQLLVAKGNGEPDHSLEKFAKIKETRYLESRLEERESRFKRIRADFYTSASQTAQNALENLAKMQNQIL